MTNSHHSNYSYSKMSWYLWSRFICSSDYSTNDDNC